MTKISIVTPSYNKDKFIGECIESVKKQKEYIFEHIIIDGLSTDKTHNIIMDKKYSKLKYYSEKDKNQSEALNKGLNYSSGDIICWLNADDFLQDDILKEIVNILKEDDWDILYGTIDIVDSNGNKLFTQYSFPYRKNYLLNMGCYIPSVGCFFRKSAIINNGIAFDENLKYVMDWDIFLKASQLNLRFKNIRNKIASFRMYEGNKTSEVKNRRIERRKVQLKNGKKTHETFFGRALMWFNYYFYRFFFVTESLFIKKIKNHK